jgi:hypothetical protein
MNLLTKPQIFDALVFLVIGIVMLSYEEYRQQTFE